MDLSTIDDIDKLKSMAYDALIAVEQLQQNLRVIQERISQVQQMPKPPVKK